MLPEAGIEPDFDFLMLADRAEVLQGKLYLMGGAWDAITLHSAHEPTSFSIAVGVFVPWNATNTPQLLAFRLEDSDGREVTTIRLSFTAGRPASLPFGTRQRVTFAVPVSLVFPGAGMYVVIATLGSRERRLPFTVHTIPVSSQSSRTP